jgi:hypothetical protein
LFLVSSFGLANHGDTESTETGDFSTEWGQANDEQNNQDKFCMSQQRFLAAVFILIIGSFCLLNAVLTGLDLIHGCQSRSWPEVEGKVTMFKVEHTIGDQTAYYVVEYAYAVEGRTYEGNEITFKIGDGSPDELRRRVDSGEKEVRVHYNPQQENQSVLYPGVNGGLIGFFIIMCCLSIFFIPFSILFCLESLGVDWDGAIRRWRRKR